MRDDKKPFYKKWWFWVVVVIVAIMIFGSSNDDANSEKEQNTPTEQISDTQQTDNEKDTYTIGDTAEMKSGKLTFESIKTLPSDQYNTPDAGNVFIEVVVLYENTTNDEYSISSMLDFSAYVDGYSIDEDFLARLATENKTVDGTVGAGKKLKGSLCYQVPENWSELEVQFGANIWKGKEVTFVINNQ